MPVRKYRSVEEMPSAAFRDRLDPENLRIAFELSAAVLRLAPRSLAPGVYRFRSVDEARARRRHWERGREDG